MSGRNGRYLCLAVLLTVLLAVFMCAAACADDAELTELIPGEWISTDEIQSDSGEIREVNMTAVFEEDGALSLRVSFPCAGCAPYAGRLPPAFPPYVFPLPAGFRPVNALLPSAVLMPVKAFFPSGL